MLNFRNVVNMLYWGRIMAHSLGHSAKTHTSLALYTWADKLKIMHTLNPQSSRVLYSCYFNNSSFIIHHSMSSYSSSLSLAYSLQSATDIIRPIVYWA